MSDYVGLWDHLIPKILEIQTIPKILEIQLSIIFN